MTNKRVLSFVVEGQTIKKDEQCDFTGLVSGTKGYYAAKFSFDKTWKDYQKVAVFRTTATKKYVPIVDGIYEIPDEVTKGLLYYVSVVGVMDGASLQATVTLPTTETFVRQKRGGADG